MLDYFTAQGDCAYFRPQGPATWQSFVALLRLAMAESKAARVTKLLVNAAKLDHAPLEVTDRFSLATEIVTMWDRSIKIVLVGRPDQLDKERFVQLVAGNRGLQLGVAGTEGEGLAWLRGETPTPEEPRS